MSITILVNEIEQQIGVETTLFQLRDRLDPAADILIRNGHPADSNCALQQGDRIVLIESGRMPQPDELEALLLARHTPGVQQRLKQARVAIAGVGGLGSSVAVALVRSGIGFLRLVDFDRVEPSNLNRQQYFLDQIGQPKVFALTETLRRIGPLTQIDARQQRVDASNIELLFGDIDILVEAFDEADQKALLTGTFLHRYPDKKLVAASGMAGFEPSNSIQTRAIGSNLVLCGDGVSAAQPGRGLMAPRVGIAAHHQANAVLRLLLGETVTDSGAPSCI